jgi:hypothetical protein
MTKALIKLGIASSYLKIKASQTWCLMPIILAIQEAEIGTISSSGQARTKSKKKVIQEKAGRDGVTSSCHPSYVGSINRKIVVPVGLGINMRPIQIIK